MANVTLQHIYYRTEGIWNCEHSMFHHGLGAQGSCRETKGCKPARSPRLDEPLGEIGGLVSEGIS
jgi:hypothetical protein